jgi:hypothetical protein
LVGEPKMFGNLELCLRDELVTHGLEIALTRVVLICPLALLDGRPTRRLCDELERT